ncbi:hydroxyproline-rich glyco protein, putative [Babesia ovata]|uniref:Hydroxyproline-rich glyco protein, putative n=1 Tax=Babesia ovata TaxID=189622 RepID=A0A2H6K769_9APIC|nr:hydroxyproline-rich glyco protein, putative [Babesia ovata]GBE58844.1 hydroxyproline-rich glyco protein, putative [Babesia ovata]
MNVFPDVRSTPGSERDRFLDWLRRDGDSGMKSVITSPLPNMEEPKSTESLKSTEAISLPAPFMPIEEFMFTVPFTPIDEFIFTVSFAFNDAFTFVKSASSNDLFITIPADVPSFEGAPLNA